MKTKNTTEQIEIMRDPKAGAEDRVAAAAEILDLVIAEEIAELRQRIERLERKRDHVKTRQ